MLDAMLATYRTHNVANHDARVRAFPGVVDTVRGLVAAGVSLAVVTSKNRPGTQRGLRAAGLDGVIETLVCVEDVERPKPHRDPVDRAVALLGADPRATIFIGDSLHDMDAGRAAEVATGAALWGPFDRAHLAPSQPSHWLSSPDDVIRLVLG
jgi:pyrophosphatase PpaX